MVHVVSRVGLDDSISDTPLRPIVSIDLRSAGYNLVKDTESGNEQKYILKK